MEDLGGQNGTYVNMQRIPANSPFGLNSEDTVRIRPPRHTPHQVQLDRDSVCAGWSGDPGGSEHSEPGGEGGQERQEGDVRLQVAGTLILSWTMTLPPGCESRGPSRCPPLAARPGSNSLMMLQLRLRRYTSTVATGVLRPS